MVALIAGTVSYLHMHMLVELHGQPGWVAALTPLSVDGMIVTASTTLLADSRSGDRGGVLPSALLVVGSAASLAANVAVAEPTTMGGVIAAWPSLAHGGICATAPGAHQRRGPCRPAGAIASTARPSRRYYACRPRTEPTGRASA